MSERQRVLSSGGAEKDQRTIISTAPRPPAAARSTSAPRRNRIGRPDGSRIPPWVDPTETGPPDGDAAAAQWAPRSMRRSETDGACERPRGTDARRRREVAEWATLALPNRMVVLIMRRDAGDESADAPGSGHVGEQRRHV